MGIRLNKVLKQLNVGTETIVEYLKSKPGLEPAKEMNPNTKVTDAQYEALIREFAPDMQVKERANNLFKKKSKKEKANKKTESFSEDVSTPNTDVPNNNDSILETESVQEENKESEIISVSLSKLHYETNCITFKKGTEEFGLWETGISRYLNSEKGNPKINNVSTRILLNYSIHTFNFMDTSLLPYLLDLSSRLENERFEKHLKNVEKKKEQEQKKKEKKEKQEKAEKKVRPKIEHRIQFSALRFGYGIISILYKKNRYVYRDSKVRDYENVLGQVYSRLSKARKNAIKTSLVWIVIDVETGTFTFKDFDIRNYINNLKDSFLPERKNTEVRKEILPKVKTVPQKPSSELKTMTLSFDNIEFFDGYFLVWILEDGLKSTSITPLRKDSSHSYARLRYVHKHLSKQFPSDIRVKYNDKKVLSLSKEYDLRDYIRILENHMDDKNSEWWIEEMNSKRESLESCRAKTNARKSAALKNEYFDILSKLQNDQKLIPAYEIDHGNKEEAFIFSIDMPMNRSAIIFENIKPARTTEFFVVKTENYESCLHRIFEHFTNYNFLTKRYSIRFGKNIADSFDAESYCYIDHKGLEQWVNCLTEKLEINRPKSNIEFISGLRIPNNPTIRSGHNTPVSLKNIHNELVIKLFAKLSEKYGKENVGTEIRVGDRRIDTVVKKDDCFDIYEVKSASTPLDCVLEASGQLLLYAYNDCSDKIGRMVIVGQSPVTEDVEKYLSKLREKHSLPMYYMKV